MGQTAFTVRMDSEVKKRFDELCKDFGMSANTAFNVFARTVIKRRRIPFEVESEEETILRRGREAAEYIRAEASKNGTANISMNEIDAEIRSYRAEKRTAKNKG